MNANMRRVFDNFKDEKDFMILSHTCMPETDSVPLLKAYEAEDDQWKAGREMLMVLIKYQYDCRYRTIMQLNQHQLEFCYRR